MSRFLAALLVTVIGATGVAVSGSAFADPDLPDPPRPPGVGDLPRPPDPPGPAPRPPAPGELPDHDDDHPWWDPLGLFDDDDDDDHEGRGHDKHKGKKHKHREKHDD